MASAFNSGFNAAIDASALSQPQIFNRSINDVLQLANANSAQSELYASNARDFSRQMQQVAMDYNAAEAAKNRTWQQMMSNTAHQREVRDLIAAGLNPVLSASGGNGASVGSGSAASVGIPGSAQGQVDMSSSGAFVQLLVSVLGAMTNLANTATSANATIASAELAKQASRYAADQTVKNANTTAAATRYSAHQAATTKNTVQSVVEWVRGLVPPQ